MAQGCLGVNLTAMTTDQSGNPQILILRLASTGLKAYRLWCRKLVLSVSATSPLAVHGPWCQGLGGFSK